VAYSTRLDCLRGTQLQLLPPSTTKQNTGSRLRGPTLVTPALPLLPLLPLLPWSLQPLASRPTTARITW